MKMSEIVHYKGVATRINQPNDKTLIDVAKDILKERNKKIKDYYDNAIECLCDNYSHEFFYHPKSQTLYKITKEDLVDEEIIKAKPKIDGTIDYELKYYNGGAGFHECLEEAFDKDMIEKAMTADKPYYAIGVDTYDKDNLSYCLTRKIDGVIEVLLSKTMSEDEIEFKQEVDNLAKYFDADVFKSGD